MPSPLMVTTYRDGDRTATATTPLNTKERRNTASNELFDTEGGSSAQEERTNLSWLLASYVLANNASYISCRGSIQERE